MKAGNVRGHWLTSGLVTILLLVYPGLGVLAQTSDSSCANDSLFLISPDAVLLEQQFVGREGLTISWQDLSLDQATCFVSTGTDTLDYEVILGAGFGGSRDRQMVFTSTNSGNVGQNGSGRLQLDWVTEGSPLNGVFGGTINVANNGGILTYSDASGQWAPLNTGLPVSWAYTNALAFDKGDGDFMVAAFSGGLAISTQFKGLYLNSGSGWQRIAEDIFSDSDFVTWVSISPENNDYFAVGTSSKGLYITNDGGQNFSHWGTNLDPSFDPLPTIVRIDGLTWVSNRLWVSSSNFGLFYSLNNGTSFVRSPLEVMIDLDEPELGTSVPNIVKEIVVNQADEDHILVALAAHGVFQSFDGGLTWSDTYGDLQNVIPSNPGAWRYNAASVLVDPGDSDILVVAMESRGLYRSVDAGQHWTLVGSDVSNPEPGLLIKMNLLASGSTPGVYFCFEDQWALLVSSDYGATWIPAGHQPALNMGTRLVFTVDGSDDLLLATYGGGIFTAGSTLCLSDSYNSSTSSELRDVDLGLEITIGPGEILAGEQFRLKAQTFQGWAVWRAQNSDPEEMVLIGLFDRTNPESCIEGYCGDTNYEIIPQCYNSKRAACFNFETADTVRFFDDEIFNGYGYYYAVSSFDYGNTALNSAENNTSIAVYSPRWGGDTMSPFEGGGNRTHIQLNDPETAAAIGEEIYVFPNPLRSDAGIPGQEGETVVFTKLPPDSRVRVFTTAGDDVIDLGPELMEDGNIYWGTRNRENESIAAGVYLYKVVMPERGDYWGKLIIIR